MVDDQSVRPNCNHFLGSLSRKDYQRLKPHLEVRFLSRGTLLADAGDPIREAWFPSTAVISFQSTMKNGEVAESGTTGREGFTGFSGLLGSNIEISRSIVQVPGEASRVNVKILQSAWRESESFRQHVLLYLRALLVQLSQSVACNALHNVQQRLARWLLMTQDRAGNDAVAITQEFLAEMLAVHRPTVTEVARELQRRKLIRYARGNIEILNRAALEKVACECYGIVCHAFALDPDASTKPIHR
jgi:CRP-like cAMP-binding protein